MNDLVLRGKEYWVSSSTGRVVDIGHTTTTRSFHQSGNALQIGNVLYVTPDHYVPYSQRTVFYLAVASDDGQHYIFHFLRRPTFLPGQRVTIGWAGRDGSKKGRLLYVLDHGSQKISLVENFVSNQDVILQLFFKSVPGAVLLILLAYFTYALFTTHLFTASEHDLFFVIGILAVSFCMFFVTTFQNVRACQRYCVAVQRAFQEDSRI